MREQQSDLKRQNLKATITLLPNNPHIVDGVEWLTTIQASECTGTSDEIAKWIIAEGTSQGAIGIDCGYGSTMEVG